VPTFLPDTLRPNYDRLWTARRTQSIVDALIKYNVALEIDSRFRVPSHRFLQVAKSAGVKFAFGSNYQTAAGLGDISYSVQLFCRDGRATSPAHPTPVLSAPLIVPGLTPRDVGTPSPLLGRGLPPQGRRGCRNRGQWKERRSG